MAARSLRTATYSSVMYRWRLGFHHSRQQIDHGSAFTFRKVSLLS